jgi:hypothetical protein
MVLRIRWKSDRRFATIGPHRYSRHRRPCRRSKVSFLRNGTTIIPTQEQFWSFRRPVQDCAADAWYAHEPRGPPRWTIDAFRFPRCGLRAERRHSTRPGVARTRDTSILRRTRVSSGKRRVGWGVSSRRRVSAVLPGAREGVDEWMSRLSRGCHGVVWRERALQTSLGLYMQNARTNTMTSRSRSKDVKAHPPLFNIIHAYFYIAGALALHSSAGQ